MLVHKFDYLAISRTTIDGRRYYQTPLGAPVPSVTSILEATRSQQSRLALQAWRDRVGHAQAQAITTEAASRGTRMHKYLEDHIKGQSWDRTVSNPYAKQSMIMAQAIIDQGFDKIDEVWGNEVPVYFPELYAGTTDCVGVHQGQPCILDFKQSNRLKHVDWIDDYFLQITAYALAHNEVYGTDICKGVIMISVKPEPGLSPVYQEFVLTPDKFQYWSDKWCERVSSYYKLP